MSKKKSSDEFLKSFEAIWKPGPAVKYSNPDSWNSNLF